MINFDSDSVICAVATPPGVGGIAVIRVCGDDSEKVVKKLCPFLPDQLESHRVYYGFLSSLSSQSKVDEVLVTYFEQGRSFTGNHVFEISCHGGSFLAKEILQNLLDAGARLSEKGEFSYRAFENGRIDLIQAESILSLIHSGSKKQAQLSLSQLEGHLSKGVNKICDDLTLILANLEANIDFAQEDIELVSPKEFVQQVAQVSYEVGQYIESYSMGKKMSEGINITLVGLPNAGKSSFLNQILGFDKAIVTDTPGTTRDIVDASFFHNGLQFNFYDTAGIHDTVDKVEQLGITKSLESIDKSDYVFYLHDQTEGPEYNTQVANIFTQLKNKKVIFLNTKSDLCPSSKNQFLDENKLADIYLESKDINLLSFIEISNKTGIGFDKVKLWLNEISEVNFNENSEVITQARHYELLVSCFENLNKSKELMGLGESPEFIASSLQFALRSLYEILGKTYDDQVMDKVFQQFCIGK